MKHLDARVGDIVQETAKGPAAPEMRIFAADGDYSHLHCEWKGQDGREEGTFKPEALTLVVQRGPAAAAEQHAVVQPEAPKPAAEQHAVVQPEAPKPAAEQHAVVQLEAPKPAAEQHAVVQPEAPKPAEEHKP